MWRNSKVMFESCFLQSMYDLCGRTSGGELNIFASLFWDSILEEEKTLFVWKVGLANDAWETFWGRSYLGPYSRSLDIWSFKLTFKDWLICNTWKCCRPLASQGNITCGKSPNLPFYSTSPSPNTLANNGRFLSQCIATLSSELSRITMANISLLSNNFHQIGEEDGEGEEQKTSLRSFTNKGFTPDTPFWTLPLPSF